MPRIHTQNLRLSPKPVMALGLGTYPKPTQIADALVYVGGHPTAMLPRQSFRTNGENYPRRPQIDLNAYLSFIVPTNKISIARIYSK